MSNAFKPVSYTALANVASVSTSSSSTGAFAPKSHASVCRITSSVSGYINIASQAADPTADVTNLYISASDPVHIKLDTKRGEISSITDPGSGSTTVVLSQPDNGTAHDFVVGDLTLPVVTAVTNSSAFTIATSGGAIGTETSGTVRKAYKMAIKGTGSGVASVHEVTLQG